VFLTTIVEDAKILSVRRDRYRGLELVGRGRIVVDQDGRTPACASIRGLDQKNIRFVTPSSFVVVGDVDVSVDGVDGNVRELIAPERRRRSRPLPDAGQPEITICPTD